MFNVLKEIEKKGSFKKVLSDKEHRIKKNSKSLALKSKKETKKEYIKRHGADLLKYETN